ncbi:peptidoglycan-binding protein [Streptomyces fungicidicus]|uniref:peptidoglycan-binding protein n=1 Tax=Streptomyces fungicidicus TaxID=68203 RepID=UPI00292A5A8D|nr:peptidoglycan-binding protein [Streptomyces fungicidicus]
MLLATGVGAGLLWAGGGGKTPGPEAGPKIRQVAVVKTDISGVREMEGTLGYDSVRTIRGVGEGVVTWLPKQGVTVARGEQLYRVDERPTVVFYGSTPMYRRLDTPGSVGRDVRVVADNLKAVGYDIGQQPAVGAVVRQRAPVDQQTSADAGSSTASEADQTAEPGSGPPPSAQGDDAGQETGAGQPAEDRTGAGQSPTPARQVTVKEGDGVLTEGLMAAIKRWQKSLDIEPTGILESSDVVVTRSAVRVSEVSAQTGDAAANDLLSVSATTKSVRIPVETLDLGTIKAGQKVTVLLPDGTETGGEVATIGTTIKADQEGESGTGVSKINVTVSVDDAEAVKGIDAAPVQVRFEAEAKKGVLAVPVGALLALREGGYAVRLAEGRSADGRSAAGRLVPVETGMFARGVVEISGEDITEGMKVEATA